MKRVYIFAHIPKTAGTSLRYHFQKHMIDQSEFIHLANKGDKVAIQNGLLPFAQRSVDERNKAIVILGHNVSKFTASLVPGKIPYQLVFFRDPIEWEISRYNQYANAKLFRNKEYLSYGDWFELEKIHSQFDWFINNYCLEAVAPSIGSKYTQLVQNLRKIDFVGFVDKIDAEIRPVFKDLGVPEVMQRENVTGKYDKRDLFTLDNNKQKIKVSLVEEYEFYLKIRSFFDRNY